MGKLSEEKPGEPLPPRGLPTTMAERPSTSLTARMNIADELLYGLDIEDEESREFLKSLIVSGQVPQDELEQLYEASLQRGVDEWDMLLECATSIKNQISSRSKSQGQPGVVPYVAYVLSGGAASDQAQSLVEPEPEPKPRKRKRKVSKRVPLAAVSHFWEDVEEATSESGPPANPHEHGPVHDLKTVSNELAQAVQSGSTAPKKKGKKSSNRRTRQSPERHGDVTASGRRTDPLKENADLPLISDENPGSLLEINSENGDDLVEGKIEDLLTKVSRPKKTAQSPYFTPAPSPKKPRLPRGTVSSIPFPPLSASRFGLIQEELAGNPFQLLVAVTFLIRTTGRAAIPAFRQFIGRFPTPEAVAKADPEDIIPMIRHLGLSAVRCATVQKYARMWMENPPSGDFRYGVRNYPRPGDARDVKAGGEYGPEVGGDVAVRQQEGADIESDFSTGVGRREVPESAWEIGHLTQGPYAIDSWRIFCRDALLGRAEDWMGKGREPTFQPEWMRVLPGDKELRACLRWMWMREGWEWDPVSGERVVLREAMRMAVDEGRVGYDDHGGLVILP